MCGIAGFLDLSAHPQAPPSVLAARARAMAGRLVHRGPDDEGIRVAPECGLGLAFRRLAIVDLSPAGHQPMLSSNGRLWLAFNGEVYNHRQLRARLLAERPQITLRGHSDTEVLLAAIETWGLAAALECSVGMFALALWDTHTRTLSLARDRLGEKPLYYGVSHGTLLFASELKAIKVHPAFDDTMDRDALGGLLRHGYIAAPRSIYRDIRKLTPGTYVEFSARASRAVPAPLPEPVTYWSARVAAEQGTAARFAGSFEAATEQLEELLRTAIADQMVADVPVGAFLSGGIDSSTVVALMQQQSARRVKTFSIGFEDAPYDEAVHARRVAQHLGTDHTELYVTPADAQAVLPQLPSIYDEPFADSSQIPTTIVARLARQQVAVSLSGDGGDELFAGYTRYQRLGQLRRVLHRLPFGACRWSGYALRSARLAKLLHVATSAAGGTTTGQLARRARRLGAMLARPSTDELYETLISYAEPPQPLMLGEQVSAARRAELRELALVDATERAMYLDQTMYLPDDILAKVDRAAMAASLETRVPLLDHRVVEFAWRLPTSYRVRAGQTKAVLRAVLARHVPSALTDRPKMGFGVPIGAWLRGPLRGWAESLLTPGALADGGLLDAAAVARVWQQHVTGACNWQHELWAVLMFQAWRAEQCAGAQPKAA